MLLSLLKQNVPKVSMNGRIEILKPSGQCVISVLSLNTFQAG